MDRRAFVWIASIIVMSSMFSFLLIVWVPTVFAMAHEHRAIPIDSSPTAGVQGTPTVDPTLTALNKEQLAQQIKQLQFQNEHDFGAWVWNSGATVITTLITVIGAIIIALGGIYQWVGNLKDARAKQAEDSFQKVVEWLGSDKEQTRIEAAILLRTFLEPNRRGYERFYRQIFELSVANLRPQHSDTGTRKSQHSPGQAVNQRLSQTHQADSHALQQNKVPRSLNYALATVFRDSFPLARDLWKKENQVKDFIRPEMLYRVLDATYVNLDEAYLYKADFGQIWMPDASLRNAFLQEAILGGAYLDTISLVNANLSGADLRNADLTNADLTNADLTNADLSEATLSGAILTGTILEVPI